MKRSLSMRRRVRARACVAALCALAACAVVLPGVSASQAAGTPADGGATFDLFSMYPEQVLSPAAGTTKTFMPLETRNITSRGAGQVALAADCESDEFSVDVDPDRVVPPKESGAAKSRVNVSCGKGTPAGTVGWIKVTGRRGSESHRIWLKVTALDSRPFIEISRGEPFEGKGYKDPALKVYTGEPLKWDILVRNDGGCDDTFELGHESEVPCKVTFRKLNGKVVESVKVEGKTRNLLYAKPVELTAEVEPEGELPEKAPVDVKLVLGPGKQTSETAGVTVRLMDPGLLYCANDLAGPRPHAHQSMPGEATSFVFHVSNTGGKPGAVKLSLSGDTLRWRARLRTTEVKSLDPGETTGAVLAMTAPRDGLPGERAEFTVTAESAGEREEVRVAAGVTDMRNVYFWAVDSMDPEYLELDRAGTGKGSDGDWLLPNIRKFMADATSYRDAKVYLPSATDMNHTNALAGTYTGTQGVYMVGGTFKGFTEHDEVLSGNNSVANMRYGPDGAPVQRIYEVAKEQTGGNALTGFWTNKNWLAELEGERAVDIVGHSERWPLFFEPPYRYGAAGDPEADKNPQDPLSDSLQACFQSHDPSAVIIPTILGQFDLFYGLKLLNMPIAKVFGKTPGMHSEDQYIYESFARSLAEEDPDISYVNVADLDNTGHFTGASWMLDEWNESKRGTASDENEYSPYIRRDEALDIMREVDVLFGRFVETLEARGLYDNSVIVFLSDHGMENMKDQKNGYEVIDLREMLREEGLLRFEDYNEVGGTEINMIFCDDPAKTARIQQILEAYTIDDPELGKVHPLTVINRQEMKDGKQFGENGRVIPGELYSEYWINNPDPNGQIWPDLFVFPLYNYQVVAHGDALKSGINNVAFNMGINIPDSVLFGFPGAHGGLQTEPIPLVFKAPSGTAAYGPGESYGGEVRIGDIAPTVYSLMGWPAPACVDGTLLPAP